MLRQRHPARHAPVSPLRLAGRNRDNRKELRGGVNIGRSILNPDGGKGFSTDHDRCLGSKSFLSSLNSSRKDRCRGVDFRIWALNDFKKYTVGGVPMSRQLESSGYGRRLLGLSRDQGLAKRVHRFRLCRSLGSGPGTDKATLGIIIPGLAEEYAGVKRIHSDRLGLTIPA